MRLSAAPTANVVVTLTRSGSTVITSNPGTVTLTTGNWSTGVNVTFTAAAGTTAATSTFAAAAPSYTGATITVNRTASGGPGRVDNPYSGAGVYNNPQWRAAAVAGGGNAIANQPTAVWFDRISAIAGNGSATTGSMGLVQHLNKAVTQDAANGSAPLVFQMVIYDLPGRDCAALASNGELGATELPRYKAEYIDRDCGDPGAAGIRGAAYRGHHRDRFAAKSRDQRDRSADGYRAVRHDEAESRLREWRGLRARELGAVSNVYNYVERVTTGGWVGTPTSRRPCK